MIVNISPGVLGRSGVNWGTSEKGDPVLLIESQVATVRIDMTAAEAQEHGAQAIFVAYGSKLAAGGDAQVRASSGLFRPDGSPL